MLQGGSGPRPWLIPPEYITVEEQDTMGVSNFILFETGSQDADGVLKIRVNGEDKYIQLYNVVS